MRITEEQIQALPPLKRKYARMKVEVFNKVRALMIDEMANHGNVTTECLPCYKVHEEVASQDTFYTTREGVRQAVAYVDPDWLHYATAFPQYAVKTAEAIPPRTQQRAVAQGGGDE